MSFNRRDFLQTLVAGATTLALPQFDVNRSSKDTHEQVLEVIRNFKKGVDIGDLIAETQLTTTEITASIAALMDSSQLPPAEPVA